ncbi:MAG: hypothetical protein ACLR0N_06020 [Bilophila wadsworthia]
MSRWSRWARRMERKSRKIREGEGNLSEERFPSPSLKPSPFPPKTFDFIESLLLVFRVDEKLFHRYGWEEFLFGDIGAVRIGEGAALLENVQVHHHHHHHLLHLLLRRKRAHA